MEFVYLVIVLALIEYIILGGLVGYARGKHGVKAPDCTGPDAFNRTFRVHQNTLEGLIVFLPGLWLFGTYLSAPVAAGLGLIGIAGRALYAKLYISVPDKRGPGAAICGIVNIVLVIGSLVGVIGALL
jgi:glutathione S-transferase